MIIRALTDEDFVQYKVPSMFIGIGTCNWKCCAEAGIPSSVCQNSMLAQAKPVYIDDRDLIQRYLSNDITRAIVIGGLEPFSQFSMLLTFLCKLRKDFHCYDPVVIYTGFYPGEIAEQISLLRYQYAINNLIVKFGRYVPGYEPHVDNVLGVKLANPQQYALRIS